MENRTSATKIAAYGLPALPLAMLGLPMYVYLPTYYADNVGLSVLAVGVILFIARLIDMIGDPLIGLISDRIQTPFGRRKPFMLTGSVVLIVSFYALIHPPETFQNGWLLVFSVLTYTGWSLVTVPYLAWSAEISSDYHTKTSLSASREMFSLCGALIALILPFAMGFSQDTAQSIRILFSAFAVLLFPMQIIALFKVEETGKKSYGHGELSSLKAIWNQMPGLKNVQTAFMLNGFANALPATLFLFYVEFILQMADKTGLLLLLYFIAGIVGMPFWSVIAKKSGKRNAWLVSMGLASVSFAFVPFLGAHDFIPFATISILSGLSLGADMALPASIQADIAQKAQIRGHDHSGILFGFWAMLTKFALALAVGAGFAGLGLSGFSPESSAPKGLESLIFLYSVLPVILKILSIWVMGKYRE